MHIERYRPNILETLLVSSSSCHLKKIPIFSSVLHVRFSLYLSTPWSPDQMAVDICLIQWVLLYWINVSSTQWIIKCSFQCLLRTPHWWPALLKKCVNSTARFNELVYIWVTLHCTWVLLIFTRIIISIPSRYLEKEVQEQLLFLYSKAVFGIYFDSAKTSRITSKIGISQVNSKNKNRFPGQSRISRGKLLSRYSGTNGHYMY